MPQKRKRNVVLGKNRDDSSGMNILDSSSMEQMLLPAACKIRGEKDAPKFKDYILPLLFIKRLSDVFDDEFKRLVQTFGSEQQAFKNAGNGSFACSVLSSSFSQMVYYQWA